MTTKQCLVLTDGITTGFENAPGFSSARNGGYYILPQSAGNSARATLAATKDVTYAFPAFIPGPCTVTEIGVEVTTNGTSSLVRLGMFNNGAGVPGTVAAQNTVATTTTGPVAAAITISVSVLASAWYWFALSQNTTSGSSVATLRAVPAANCIANQQYPLAYTSQPTNANAGTTGYQPAGYSYTGFSNGVVFTDSPTAGESVLTSQTLPMLWFKVTVP